MDKPRLNTAMTWDTHTAAAVIVVGALAFLVAIRHGFRPVVVG